MDRVDDFLYEKESYQIRGACFEVYNKFGGAFKESIVDKSLTLELKSRGMEVEDQKRIDIHFKGVKVGTYIPDKIVNEKIILELKSKAFLLKSDFDQFWKYLKGSSYKLGFLINFGPSSLEIKRVVYDKARSQRKFTLAFIGEYFISVNQC
ncbi:MAG: hypothetical protein ACD_56C00148G0002 [uncultured bacterium]|nr:MAG: hypothetical protein ACD_56C00148G0002 [uncultured bacterium]